MISWRSAPTSVYAACAQGIALCWEPHAVAYLDLSQARSGCPVSAQLRDIAAAVLSSRRTRKAAHQLPANLAALTRAGMQVPHTALPRT